MSKKASRGSHDRQTLTSYEPVEVTVPRITFSDEVIDEQITQLAAHMKELQAIEPRALQPDDRVLIEMTTIDGEGARLENLCGLRHVNLADEFIPAGFKEGLFGLAPGQERSFEYDAPTPENDAQGNAVTMKVQATVRLLEIQEERTPEVNDGWVERHVPGASSLAELRENVRKQMETKAGAYTRSKLYEACAAELATRLNGSIPDEEFERGIIAAQREFDDELKREKTTKEAYLAARGMTDEQLSIQLLARGRQMIAEGRALEAMARHLHLSVQDEDIEAVFGQVTPAQARKMRESYSKAGRGSSLRRMALCGKALDYVVNHANVTYRDMPQGLQDDEPQKPGQFSIQDIFGGSRGVELD